MNEIVEIKVNQLRRKRYVNYGEHIYKVKWHGFGPEEDIWEPPQNLPHSKIFSIY